MTLSNPNPYLAANFAIFSCTGSTAGASSSPGSEIGFSFGFSDSGFNSSPVVFGISSFSIGFDPSSFSVGFEDSSTFPVSFGDSSAFSTGLELSSMPCPLNCDKTPGFSVLLFFSKIGTSTI